MHKIVQHLQRDHNADGICDWRWKLFLEETCLIIIGQSWAIRSEFVVNSYLGNSTNCSFKNDCSVDSHFEDKLCGNWQLFSVDIEQQMFIVEYNCVEAFLLKRIYDDKKRASEHNNTQNIYKSPHNLHYKTE